MWKIPRGLMQRNDEIEFPLRRCRWWWRCSRGSTINDSAWIIRSKWQVPRGLMILLITIVWNSNQLETSSLCCDHMKPSSSVNTLITTERRKVHLLVINVNLWTFTQNFMPDIVTVKVSLYWAICLVQLQGAPSCSRLPDPDHFLHWMNRVVWVKCELSHM